MTAPALVLAAAIAAALFAGRRARVVFALCATALVLVLIGQSEPRLVGDSGEYIAMAINLGQFERPSLTSQDLVDATTYVPGNAGISLVKPEFRAADGRQDFPHFWFYSLLAAPFVRVAIMLGKNPITGFTVLNVLLLVAAALALERRFSASAAAFLVLGPVLWWVDKAHTEVFTVALLAIAVAFLETAPWWSIVALGAAATQNPPVAGAMLVAAIYAVRGWGPADRRVVLGTVAGIALSALHPLYFHERLGVWSGLYLGVDRHWPSSTELLAPMTDLNLGIFVHDPFIVLAAAGAVIVALTRDPRRIVRAPHVVVALAGLLFLVSFTQTGNFNSGGTPGPSRYGLWLLPLAIPVIAPAASAWWMRAIAVASVVWCSSHFAPRVPEQYLQPTEIADTMWHREPQIDNPLAEVFAERVSGREPPQKPPIATSGCEKLLVVGDGINVEWPSQCDALVPKAPSECRESGALCYANRTLTSYAFTRAAASPSWVQWEQRPEVLEISQSTGVQSGPLTLPPAEHPQPTLWLGDGWSYVEHELGAPQTMSTWRWMGDRARLDVVAPAAMRLRMRLVLAAYSKPRRLRISLGATAVVTVSVSEGQHGYETPPVDLAAGSNSFVFESLDGTGSPGAKDARRLSIALFHADVAP